MRIYIGAHAWVQFVSCKELRRKEEKKQIWWRLYWDDEETAKCTYTSRIDTTTRSREKQGNRKRMEIWKARMRSLYAGKRREGYILNHGRMRCTYTRKAEVYVHPLKDEWQADFLFEEISCHFIIEWERNTKRLEEMRSLFAFLSEEKGRSNRDFEMKKERNFRGLNDSEKLSPGGS